MIANIGGNDHRTTRLIGGGFLSEDAAPNLPEEKSFDLKALPFAKMPKLKSERVVHPFGIGPNPESMNSPFWKGPKSTNQCL